MASEGPRRAPGPPKIDPGRKTGPGEVVGTSGDPLGPRIEKIGARGCLGEQWEARSPPRGRPHGAWVPPERGAGLARTGGRGAFWIAAGRQHGPSSPLPPSLPSSSPANKKSPAESAYAENRCAGCPSLEEWRLHGRPVRIRPKSDQRVRGWIKPPSVAALRWENGGSTDALPESDRSPTKRSTSSL